MGRRIQSIIRQSTKEEEAEVSSREKKLHGTKGSGEGRGEPAVLPPVPWVRLQCTRREREKKGKRSKWDGKTKSQI